MTSTSLRHLASSVGCTASALLLLLYGVSLAQSPDQFDTPVSVKTVEPKADDSIEIRCTYFSDLVVRERVDGPESENAAIVRDANAPCTADTVPGETLLDTAGMTLDGRRGAFLLFSDLDPHGAPALSSSMPEPEKSCCAMRRSQIRCCKVSPSRTAICACATSEASMRPAR
jgi:hypothetical protein